MPSFHRYDDDGWCQNAGCMWNGLSGLEPKCPTRLTRRPGTLQEAEKLLEALPNNNGSKSAETHVAKGGSTLREELKGQLHEMLDDWAEATEVEDFKERNARLDEIEAEATDAILKAFEARLPEERAILNEHELSASTGMLHGHNKCLAEIKEVLQ